MSQRLENKVALITGGASGIGRECALTFAAEGASLVVADLNSERADAVVDEVIAAGGEAIGIGVDTSQPEEVSSMVQGAIEKFGRIDVCVAAAGISHASYVSREPD